MKTVYKYIVNSYAKSLIYNGRSSNGRTSEYGVNPLIFLDVCLQTGAFPPFEIIYLFQRLKTLFRCVPAPIGGR